MPVDLNGGSNEGSNDQYGDSNDPLFDNLVLGFAVSAVSLSTLISLM